MPSAWSHCHAGRCVLLAYLLLASCCVPGEVASAVEQLNRGVVAVRQSDRAVYVGWRLLPTDPHGTSFNVYRHAGGLPPHRVNETEITGATNLADRDAPRDQPLEYSVRSVVDGQEQAPAQSATVWEKGFLEIPLATAANYRPGDAAVGDLDGDGEWEIVLHQVSAPRDNGSAGVTGTPILDAYKLDGTRLWRIDLGKNIREGEHYTQFMVFDLDGDGCAEVACKTGDGTIDGAGNAIGDAERDWRTLREGSPRNGRILDGPEYFTVFDGPTGRTLKTVDYLPARDPIDGWGGIGGNAGNDDYGNRCDRFLACVAFLDGQRPSVVMCRGVYGRIVMAAWDWRDGQLSLRWKFDTGISYPPYDDSSPYSGMGGHSLSVADVDDDGRDEIVYQGMVVDDDGTGLYSTGLRHGDAMYISDLDPERPGLEVFTVQENEDRAEVFQTPGAAFRDARTGEILWSHSPAIDVPNGMAADIDPRYRGFEMWGGPGGLRNTKGETIGRAPRETRWTLWWDGDPLRELLSPGGGARRRSDPAASPQRRGAVQPTLVSKWNWEAESSEVIDELDAIGVARGPALLGDLIGDWREELLLVAPDGQALRLYTTTIPTQLRLQTLLADRQYRLGLVWQNVVYNKPCYPSFYLGDNRQDLPAAADP